MDYKSNKESRWWKDIKVIGTSTYGIRFWDNLYWEVGNEIAFPNEWINGIWVWRLEWRRLWFEWEKPMVKNVISFIELAKILNHKDDNWKWCKYEDYNFTVKSAYEIIEEKGLEEWEGCYSKLWGVKSFTVYKVICLAPL